MSGFSIPGINVGKSQHSTTKINLDNDFHSTHGWGILQPYLCQELVGNSKMVLDMESLVRCAPLVAPTMARIKHRVYHQFVAIEDLMDNFENLLSGTKYSTSGSSGYVPTKVPVITMNFLTLFALKYAERTFYTVSGSGEDLAMDTYVEDSTISYSTFLADYTSGYHSSLKTYLTPTTQNRTGANAIKPEGADFVFCGQVTHGSSDKYFMYCFRLNKFGCNFRKVCLGLGYQLDILNTREISALPLIAYYKAYFDIFVPKQNINWKMTGAYRMLDNFRQYGTFSVINSMSNDFTKEFMESLVYTYYTDNPDFVSAHIATPAISNSAFNQNQINPNSPIGLGTSANNVYAPANGQPAIDAVSANSGSLTQQKLELLQKLYKWTNKNTILGQKVADYLKAHYGVDLVHDLSSNYIGASVSQINISDVMSNADTYNATDESGARLGEYSGKGIGYFNGGKLTWKAKHPGFWITMGCITPDSRYYQGCDPALSHIDRFSFYDGAWDSLGFEITPVDNIACTGDVVAPDRQLSNSGGFGFVPRLTSYKVKSDRISGDMSRRSLRDTYSPYQLDRMITRDEINDNTTQGYVSIVRSSIPGASTEWRYPTKFSWLGNYNRIFANGGSGSFLDVNYADWEAQDNFILHCVFKVDVYAKMLSIADSYETSEGDNINVEKA